MISEHISPISAWCPVDEAGVLQIQHLQYFRHNIMTPAGANWRMVRVVVDVMESYEERDEAVRAIDALPDCVACAMLGAQDDVRPKLPPPCRPRLPSPPPPPPPPGSLAEMLSGQADPWAEGDVP